ncbi:LysR family transcriptional regulator [Granulosicoccus sp. 3-233]|uniref:LysR family transcriptional regulator n=1 Tax=Granulosicoccus sp. 3-233 TaxID=3417969 RepID=UPI003D332E37
MTGKGNSYGALARSSADLCAFMLVCQHGKLSLAAQAMQLSQPSLSQRIRNLETTLGRQLFTRHSSGVDLTHAGRELLRLLGQPLEQAATRFDQFLTHTGTERIVISVDHAFGSFWLLPRLPQLREESGTTDICIISSQDPRNSATPEADIRIFMARPAEVAAESVCLLAERVSAVCSAAFLASHREIRSVQDLSNNPSLLLHLASPAGNSCWIDWRQWFESHDIFCPQLPTETSFNSYEMIINAARRSQGVALGWHGLIDDLLTDGELVTLFPDSVSTDSGYYMSMIESDASPGILGIRDWILQQALSLQSSNA